MVDIYTTVATLVLQDFIISDLKMHYDLAVSWLYHEYARDIGGDQYDHCLTSLLQGAKATLEPRDRLVVSCKDCYIYELSCVLVLGCFLSWFWMLRKSLPMLCKLSNLSVMMKLVLCVRACVCT